MPNLPIDFTSELSASGEFNHRWQIKSGSHEASVAIPTEFGGKGGGFSPEDLFLQALMNCFVGTFKVYAKGSKVGFSKIEMNGRLAVDKNEAGKIVMREAHFDIRVLGADRPDRVQTLVEKTFKDGFILNSVTTQIKYDLQVFETGPQTQLSLMEEA